MSPPTAGATSMVRGPEGAGDEAPGRASSLAPSAAPASFGMWDPPPLHGSTSGKKCRGAGARPAKPEGAAHVLASGVGRENDG